MPVMPPRKPYDIDHMFAFHQGDEHSTEYEAIRAAARVFAEVIVESTPAGSDQDDALRHVRKAMLMAREAINLDGDLYQCEVIARKLADHVFNPAEAEGSRVREVRMNPQDASKLVGFSHFHRSGVELDGVYGAIWGATVVVSSEIPVGHVVVTVEGSSDDGSTVSLDAVSVV